MRRRSVSREQAASPVLQGDLENIFKFMKIMGFCKKTLDRERVSLVHDLLVFCGGKKYKGDVLPSQVLVLMDLLSQFQAVHHRHIHIADDQEGLIGGGPEVFKSFLSVLEYPELIAAGGGVYDLSYQF